MIRSADWQDRLHAYLDSVADTPFAWGTHDCCLYIADAVQAMTGVDPAAAYRGRYSTETGARIALTRYGAGTLYATFNAAFGDSIAPAGAHRGDIVAIDEMTVGVCMGAFGWFVGDDPTGKTGLMKIPRAEFVQAWAIPYE